MKYQFANRKSVTLDKGLPNTISSVINVTDIQGPVTDVNITVDVDHTFTSDLVISLIGPDDTRVLLVGNEGGKQDDFILTKFDDSAFQPVTSASAPFTGSFKPEESLDVYNQLDPNGPWILEIKDTAFEDGGMLKSWMLDIEAPDTHAHALFFENTNPQIIDSGQSNTVVSAIHVTGHSNKILESIKVKIDIEHTYDKDLTITLISPDNQRIKLVNRRGGSENNFQSTIFSDDADKSITKGKAPFNNSFQPEESLVSLKGVRITGAWLLEVVDNAWDDGGVLNTWSISIETSSVSEDQPASQFKIVVEFQGGLSSTQKAVFEDAAERWTEIIVGELPPEEINGITIEGIYIAAKGESIDSTGGVLGQARPVHLRQNSYLPVTGIMSFDTADLENMENNGSLLDVIVHEMGHVIGIGTIWNLLGLLQGQGSVNPLFTGENAQAEYAKLLEQIGRENVPVEGNNAGPGTADAHWQDSTFGSELMTGYINRGVKNAISRLTVASLKDMGYQVNMDAADDYSLPSSMLLAELTAAPDRMKCCLHQHDINTPFIVNGELLNLTASEVTFMEQISWTLSLSATSGITLGDSGTTEVGASTSIPVTLDPGAIADLNLQLTVTDKLEVFSIISNIYDGTVEVTANSKVFKLTGPIMLFGDLIEHFSTDLTTLTVENKHLTDQAVVKIVIGRTLV